jgi:hypothetical protein
MTILVNDAYYNLSLFAFPTYYHIPKGLFGAHDKATGYDKIILSCLNPLFGVPRGKDKYNILLILSYCSFVILILIFSWVKNLIA